MNEGKQSHEQPSSNRRRDDPFETVPSPGVSGPIDVPECPQRIGRYEIERLIGVGGIGRVFLAHDPA